MNGTMMPPVRTKLRRIGKTKNPKQAFKGWGECMEAFLGASSLCFKPLVLKKLDDGDDNCLQISWSSSDDDDNDDSRYLKRRVVTKLNFNDCTPYGARRTRLIKSETKCLNTSRCEERISNDVSYCETNDTSAVKLNNDNQNESSDTGSPVLKRKCRVRSFSESLSRNKQEKSCRLDDTICDKIPRFDLNLNVKSVVDDNDISLSPDLGRLRSVKKSSPVLKCEKRKVRIVNDHSSASICFIPEESFLEPLPNNPSDDEDAPLSPILKPKSNTVQTPIDPSVKSIQGKVKNSDFCSYDQSLIYEQSNTSECNAEEENSLSSSPVLRSSCKKRTKRTGNITPCRSSDKLEKCSDALISTNRLQTSPNKTSLLRISDVNQSILISDNFSSAATESEHCDTKLKRIDGTVPEVVDNIHTFSSDTQQLETNTSSTIKESQVMQSQSQPTGTQYISLDTSDKESPIVAIKEGIARGSSNEIQAISSSGCDSEESSIIAKWGSEWLREKELHCKSPGKVIVVQDPDSGKKRRKFKQEGLASRLYRLLNRRRSSACMWYHELPHSSKKLKHESITLRVQKVCSEFFHLVLQCFVVSSELDTSTSDESSNVKQEESQITIISDYLDLLKQLDIQQGSIIRVYPPWKKLNYGSPARQVLLGVNLMEIVQDNSLQRSEQQQLFEQVSVLKEFKCLCQCDPSVSTKQCKFQFEHGGLEILNLMGLVQTKIPSCVTGERRVTHEVVTEESLIQSGGTIAEAILGHSGKLSIDICIKVRFERVFLYRKQSAIGNPLEQNENDVHWSVLCQDNKGELCEILISDDIVKTSNIWSAALDAGDGDTFEVSGLTITQRVNKTRSLGLLAVMESMNASDSINEKDEKGKRVASGDQLFLYIFSATEASSIKKTEMGLTPWIPPYVSTLYDVIRMKTSSIEKRFTFIVKLICSLESSLYITDPSLTVTSSINDEHTSYVMCEVKNVCCIPNLEDLNPESSPVFYLRDVAYSRGRFYMDKYSRIISLSTLRKCNRQQAALVEDNSDLIWLTQTSVPDIPELSVSSRVKELVTVVGNVVGIDEATAMTWPICGNCQNEMLLEVHEDQYYCQRCVDEVQKVEMKIMMEVYISSANLPVKCQVKIKLLQESIQKLLPESPNESGYDSASILGKLVDPLLCVVVKKSAHEGDSAKFLLEEVKCFK